jgi:hypothetical protein
MNIDDLIRDDGYFNITKLFNAQDKRFHTWHRLHRTKAFIKKVSEIHGIPEEELIYKASGRNYQTRVHPLIATDIAQWISVEFAVNVAKWIEEWKEKKENKEKYLHQIRNIVPDDYNTCKEREIQERLHKELRGVKEYKTINGNIDLLTDSDLIEIKVHENWKHGIGQILAYSTQLRDHKLRLHLFDGQYDKNIEDVCNEFNISVTWETS